ncbi:NAD(P)-dependent oxidoreductase [Salegentibacter sp. F188]|uniref:NAD(P)-dependent oxidoreductase n=1 Tax=Autumnicola patrickiae TaxID=3075591 RepID=A0ABU3DXY9_9FLAO|nr:NAD(P)-dependent oxidoreductase [Salegentibacter sp. F188]MDT0688594.1 NAD(P)-dependent oxidoreductase [Salegentibacter sp. F188]
MKALITEPLDFGRENLKLLEEIAEVKKGPFSRSDLLKAVGDIDVLMIRLGHVIDEEVFKKANKLKFILTPTTGLNHIEFNTAEKRGIKVISLKGESAFLAGIPSTAEHTWALMLALLRKIPAAHHHVMNGNWKRDHFKAHNLYHYKLGILGFGRVGKQIAEYARVFKMPFVFYDTDPNLNNHPNAVEDLEQFMKEIDILSIHIPLNQENTKFLNEANLKYLKPTAYILNTSRGEVIDEPVLADMLVQKKLSGLATDVLALEISSESRKNNTLINAAKKLENIIITPHIAGATYESMWRTEEFVIKKWMEILQA